jgi:hypothetical protein
VILVTSVVEFDKKEERRLLRKLGRLSQRPQALGDALTKDAFRLLHLGTRIGFATYLAFSDVHDRRTLASATFSTFLVRSVFRTWGDEATGLTFCHRSLGLCQCICTD